MMRFTAFILMLTILVADCSTKNAASSFTKDTPEEQARKKLDAGEYADAIELYEEIIAGDATRYDLYPLLSSAYAGSAGIDLLNIVKQQFGGGGGGESIFDTIGAFVPASPDDTQLASIRRAVELLKSMPEANRNPLSEITYAAAAAFQLTLYLAASSAMTLNRFAVPTETGALDPAKLEEMTEADVENILNNLEDIVATQTAGTANEAISAQVGTTLEAINAQPGATQKEKLLSYIAATKGTNQGGEEGGGEQAGEEDTGNEEGGEQP